MIRVGTPVWWHPLNVERVLMDGGKIIKCLPLAGTLASIEGNDTGMIEIMLPDRQIRTIPVKLSDLRERMIKSSSGAVAS